MKVDGQLDLVEYSRINAPDSVHTGDPAGGCGIAEGEEFSERTFDGMA